MDVRISTESVRILIADFDVLFRSSLRALLNERDGYLVLGEAKDKTSLLTMVRELKPNLLLLSWELSQHDDMAVLRELVDCEDSPRIVLFSFPSNSIDVAPAIRNGVVGILSKEATAESLFDAIEKVNQGQYFLGQAGLASLVESATNRNPKTGFQKARRMFGITRREFDIIPEVVARGDCGEIIDELQDPQAPYEPYL
jgi:DNA-binding NarL/FixJ family response regulator